jgi:hypothetical protein
MGVVKVPQGLGPDGRRAWRRAVTTMAAIAVDADLFEGQLERLANLADDLALARKRWIAKRRPLVEQGSAGQNVIHSLVRVQAELSKQILTLETELGLTLVGQRKTGHGVRGGRPQGAASAPDRAGSPSRRKGNVFPLSPAVEEAIERAGSR